MSSPTLHTVLGARQAEIMQYLWTHGSATIREFHTAIALDGLPQYEAVLAAFIRLQQKGLVARRRVMTDESATRAKQAYVYVPAVTEAALLRRARPAPLPLPPTQQPF